MDSSRKKDITVGLVILLAIVLFTWGYNFLKGKDFFKNYSEYYLHLNNTNGVVDGTPVLINGVNVGSVTGIDLAEDNTVNLTITLPNDIQIYQNTRASIFSPDLLNGKAIAIEYSPQANQAIKPGDTIPTVVNAGILGELQPQVQEMLPDVQTSLENISQITGTLNKTLDAQSSNNIRSTVANLSTTTNNLNNLTAELNKNLYNINKTLQYTAQFTQNLAANNQAINSTLSNIEQLSQNLASTDLNRTIGKLDATLENLNSILLSADTTEGTLGLLLHDKGLYYRLNSTTESLNALIDDIKANPSRYIKINVLGRSK